MLAGAVVAVLILVGAGAAFWRLNRPPEQGPPPAPPEPPVFVVPWPKPADVPDWDLIPPDLALPTAGLTMQLQINALGDGKVEGKIHYPADNYEGLKRMLFSRLQAGPDGKLKVGPDGKPEFKLLEPKIETVLRYLELEPGHREGRGAERGAGRRRLDDPLPLHPTRLLPAGGGGVGL